MHIGKAGITGSLAVALLLLAAEPFPGHWLADSIYLFTEKSGMCNPEAQGSGRHLKWPCDTLNRILSTGAADAADMPPPEGLGKRGRRRWQRYLDAEGHKAFARGEGRRFGWASKRSSVEEAKEAAIRDCEKRGDTCRIVSVDGKPVGTGAVAATAAAAEMPPPEGLGKRGRRRWQRYLDAEGHKAFARGEGRQSGSATKRSSVEKAKKAAIRNCEKRGGPCRIVSVNGKPIDTGAAAAGTVAAKFSVSMADPAWDGSQIPDGQQCSKFGGKGATPAMRVENIPAGTNAVIVEFNDYNYHPLSYDGGHGKIGFQIEQGSKSAVLPSVPGETNTLPTGSFVERENQATGDYATLGYLPPCSGGGGHLYFADVKAVKKTEGQKAEVLAETQIVLGKY